MALPARILLKQEGIPRNARETLFQLVELTAIINGANLSDTNVWPEMNQPFLLVFARNRRPKPGHLLHFITPVYDKSLNRNGELRIDSKSSQQVETEATFTEPWVWKALAVGTSLDVDVLRSIHAAGGVPIQEYWEAKLGLTSGTGYMIKENQKQRDASFLIGLPNLESGPTNTFQVDASSLQKWTRKTACRPRTRELYRAPLALIKQAPGPDRHCCWALLSLSDVTFNQSCQGYSGAGHPEAELLVRYLQLFAHSSIRLHYALTTGPRFGAERRVLDKSDFDECPIIPFDQLLHEQKKFVRALSERLLSRDSTVFDEIDSFFGTLFGLGRLDLEVIRDTLEVSLPYGVSRERACKSPTPFERDIFCRRVESAIRPFFKVLSKEPQVVVPKSDDEFLRQESPFGIVLVRERGESMPKPDELFQRAILQLADDTGASRIIQQVDGGLLVSILNQYRYWTPSRARLLGAEIVRQHMDVFED